jgi:hypothetical protein
MFCNQCGSAVRNITYIEKFFGYGEILDHLDAKSEVLAAANQLPEASLLLSIIEA